MPIQWIRRDETDPTVITMHVTQEISPLPLSAAANKLTTFFVKENEEMPLSKQKREYLVSVGYSDSDIDNLEGRLKETADAASAAGIESKEQSPAEDTDAETVPAAPATDETEVPVAEATEPEAVDAGNDDAEPDTVPVGKSNEIPSEAPITRGEIAQALKAIGDLFANRLDSVDTAVAALVTEVKSLKEEDAVKVAKAAEVSPAMSITDLLAGMFSKEAVVDGRTQLAKQKPAEPKSDAPVVTGLPYIDSLFVTTPRE